MAWHRILEAGAPSDEHERMVADLHIWANRLGFREEGTRLKIVGTPDVVRRKVLTSGRYIFIGDAKRWDTQPPKGKHLDSIEGYVSSFGAHLEDGKILGGFIAIATNNHATSLAWAVALNSLLNDARIVYADSSPIRCKVFRSDGKRTWIAYA